PAGAAGKAHVGGVAADQLRDVDRPAGGVAGAGDAVGDGRGQRGAVVDHVHAEGVAAVQVDAGRAQIHERCARRDPAAVQPGRARAFPAVVVEIELHGHALLDASGGRAADVARVAETPSAQAQRVEPGVLHGEGKAVAVRVGQLEREVV